MVAVAVAAWPAPGWQRFDRGGSLAVVAMDDRGPSNESRSMRMGKMLLVGILLREVSWGFGTQLDKKIIQFLSVELTCADLVGD